MYSYGYSYGYGLIGGNTYNPLINYDWSTTTTSGLRYLKDVGSTPTYNASMYFGRGAYLNGVDQTITVPINTTIQTSLKRVNGIVTINETSQALTDYVISGLGVHKDYYLFTRLLTTAEKDSYIATPELFYAMAQSDNTCVLNMPMCETDGYARNMKSYSEVEKILNTNFTVDENWTKQTGWTISGGTLNADGTGTPSQAYQSGGLVLGSLYKVTYTVSSYTSGIVRARAGYATLGTGRTAVGTYTEILICSGNTNPEIRSESFIGSIDNVSFKLLTNIYPITNYTSSVRDNAKNLQYGLQTCKFVRDSLGVIQSASDYLEGDGVGYGNTGWIPSSVNSATIEYICYIGLSGFYLSGTRSPNFRLGSSFGNAFFQTVSSSLSTNTNVNNNNYNLLTMEYNQIADNINCYVNGVFVGNRTIGNISVSSLVFELGKTGIEYYLKTPIKLFKVHNKALTQAEITANYNSYVAKGLLS